MDMCNLDDTMIEGSQLKRGRGEARREKGRPVTISYVTGPKETVSKGRNKVEEKVQSRRKFEGTICRLGKQSLEYLRLNVNNTLINAVAKLRLGREKGDTNQIIILERLLRKSELGGADKRRQPI